MAKTSYWLSKSTLLDSTCEHSLTLLNGAINICKHFSQSLSIHKNKQYVVETPKMCTEEWLDRNQCWDDCVTVNVFLRCIPLKVAVFLVAIGGLCYGILGLSFFISIVVHYGDYRIVYANKEDVLIYLLLICGIVVQIFFGSGCLLYGIIASDESTVFMFLWTIVIHVFLCCFLTLSMSSYCLFGNIKCFQETGLATVIISLIITIFYSAAWIYVVVAVNSYRIHTVF